MIPSFVNSILLLSAYVFHILNFSFLSYHLRPTRRRTEREGGARLVGWGVLELWELGAAGRATPKPCNSQLRCRSVAK